MTERERLIHLYTLYQKNACNKAEELELMHLVAQDENQEELDKLLTETWDQTDESRQMDSVRAKSIFTTIVTRPATKVNKSIRIYQRNWFRIAAVFLLIGTTAVLFSRPTGPAATKPVIKQIAAVKAETVKDRKSVKLPDGSIVILNEGSSLSYPAAFTTGTREVTLIGEAYFDIKHNPSKPFIVHAGTLKTIVLGTAFNIKAYRSDKSVTVTVTRGKVSVQRNNRTIGVLLPNQQIVFNKTDLKINQLAINAVKVLEWQSKDLFFDDITMEDAVKVLRSRFKVDINFTNEGAKNCRFTGTILDANNINLVLRVICEFNNSTYKIKNNGTILISGDGCPSVN